MPELLKRLYERGGSVLERAILSERIAACRLRGALPPAGLRREIKRLHRFSLRLAPSEKLCCHAGQCLVCLGQLLGEVCPLSPGFVQCSALGNLYVPLGAEDLGRFLLFLLGGLWPPDRPVRLSLYAGEVSGRVCIRLCFAPADKKIPSRSFRRSANRWAAKRGGTVLFLKGQAVLALPQKRFSAVSQPIYALWAFDRCSPAFSLLPLRLILPD